MRTSLYFLNSDFNKVTFIYAFNFPYFLRYSHTTIFYDFYRS